MANSARSTKFGKWVRGECAKMKKRTAILEKAVVCEACVEALKGIVAPDE